MQLLLELIKVLSILLSDEKIIFHCPLSKSWSETDNMILHYEIYQVYETKAKLFSLWDQSLFSLNGNNPPN